MIPGRRLADAARGDTRLTLDARRTITAIEIDPEHAFPDIDRSNNRWTKS